MRTASVTYPLLLSPPPSTLHPAPPPGARYTKSLKGQTNPATGSLWTNAERTTEAQRLYPLASLHLLCGMVDHNSLLTIGHPATKQSWYHTKYV